MRKNKKRENKKEKIKRENKKEKIKKGCTYFIKMRRLNENL